MSDELSRRRFIRNSSAAAATVVLAGLAGCTSSLPLIGDDDAALNAYLFAPSFDAVLDEDELMDDEDVEESKLESRAFRHVDPEAVFDNEAEIDTHWPVGRASDLRERAGVAATDTDWGLEQDLTYEYETSRSSYQRTADIDVEIVAGEFDTGTVEDTLEKWAEDEFGHYYDEDDDEEAFESAGSEPGFDLYEVEDYVFGVSEEHLIQAEADTPLDGVAAVEAAIDAFENEADLWTDDNDGSDLLEEFDQTDVTSGNLYQPVTVETVLEDRYDDPDDADIDDEEREEIEDAIDGWMYGLVGQTKSRDIDGDTTDIHQVFLYESESEADSDALLEHVEANRDYEEDWGTLEDYSVSEEGRALILTGEVRSRAAF